MFIGLLQVSFELIKPLSHRQGLVFFAKRRRQAWKQTQQQEWNQWAAEEVHVARPFTAADFPKRMTGGCYHRGTAIHMANLSTPKARWWFAAGGAKVHVKNVKVCEGK